ncbi:MAG: hypothetical protein ABWZ78_02500 [Burkholderiaceae bacterium]
MTGSPGSRRPAIAPWVHVAALAGYTVLCVAWSLFAGRDLNWDQLNHHLYLGHLWHHGRLDRDFMAAGGQSYYNPLPYLPFHALVVGGWSSNTITALLGVLHSLNAWLLHAIGWSVFRGRYGGPGNQIFLGELGDRSGSDSVCNRLGTYGSAFSSTSIWSRFSDYGGSFSNYSAFSRFASNPPVVVNSQNQSVGYFTIGFMPVAQVAGIPSVVDFFEESGGDYDATFTYACGVDAQAPGERGMTYGMGEREFGESRRPASILGLDGHRLRQYSASNAIERSPRASS